MVLNFDTNETMNRWIIWTITLVIFISSIQTYNLKPYSKLTLSILIIHVVIGFNGNHFLNFG